MKQLKDYTTTDVTIMLGISRSKVVKLIDTGELIGYTLTPGSTHRRVTPGALAVFIRRNKLPETGPAIQALMRATLDNPNFGAPPLPEPSDEADAGDRTIEEIVRNVELFVNKKDYCIETIRQDVASVLAGYKVLMIGK